MLRCNNQALGSLPVDLTLTTSHRILLYHCVSQTVPVHDFMKSHHRCPKQIALCGGFALPQGQLNNGAKLSG
jgi:hypothetical protein